MKTGEKEPDLATALLAAKTADWEQVILNGGPPCFHLEGEKFCFRAQRWAGHADREWPRHKFVSLEELLRVVAGEPVCRCGQGFTVTCPVHGPSQKGRK